MVGAFCVACVLFHFGGVTQDTYYFRPPTARHLFLASDPKFRRRKMVKKGNCRSRISKINQRDRRIEGGCLMVDCSEDRLPLSEGKEC